MTLKCINRESFESEPFTTRQPLIKFYTNRQQLQPCQVKEQRKVYNTKEQRPSKLKWKWKFITSETVLFEKMNNWNVTSSAVCIQPTQQL